MKMKNNEICEYINSKDVRKYLLNTEYVFSSAEAAWLVYHHENISLARKLEAWKSILNSMPDCKVIFGNDKFESFHEALFLHLPYVSAYLNTPCLLLTI